MPAGAIRRQRVRKFLITHGVLCGLAFVMTTVETLSGVQPNLRAIIGSYAVSVLAGLATVIGALTFRRDRVTNLLVPGILSLDSLLVMVQMYNEGGLDSGWAAAPVLLTILLPLYTDDRRLLWGVAGLQIAAYFGLYALRSSGLVEYPLRDMNSDAAFYSMLGFVFIIVGAAVFAGQASLDVLNSQRQLEREIDQATKALREAQDQLVQQAKMAGLGQLTAGVAHEINNPLTFVQTNLTSIERDVVDILGVVGELTEVLPMVAAQDPERAADLEEKLADLGLDDDLGEILGELIDDTREGLARVQHIIADLRTFSRAETARRTEVDLNQVVAEALDAFGRGQDAVEVRRALGGLPKVPLYPLLFNQVLLNLLGNAADAVRSIEDGAVTVRTRREGDDVVVEVEDNGPGVAPEIRDRIFEPFFTTKEVGEGTGLGLAISYQIIEHHRGRIEVGDRAGGGAIFRVRLPVHAPPLES